MDCVSRLVGALRQMFSLTTPACCPGEDVEPDIEHVDFVSLFSDANFDNLPNMLAHMKKKYDFDLAKVKLDLSE